jgi:hypothetical protein
MACGTHVITGDTGKYKGISGSEPFACNSLPALAGEGGYTSMYPAQHHLGDQRTITLNALITRSAGQALIVSPTDRRALFFAEGCL